MNKVYSIWYIVYGGIRNKSPNSKFQIPNTGFTLIELMVVISIIALLAGFGVAAFSKFNQTQSLQQAASDLKNNLRLAQSKALAQEKPTSGCGVLDGYRVEVSPLSYSMVALCDGRNPLASSRQAFPSLPQAISLSPPAQVDFYLLGGGATEATITVSGFGKNVVVNVTKTGEIY